MVIYKCKMCGGSLSVQDGATVVECEYCGTRQTVSTSNDEVIVNLFNRANNLRLKSEYDKAAEVYEQILALDDTQAEAHWGLVLCKYGVEYVEDPLLDERIPTCHRTQMESILSDAEYLAVIQYADSVSQSVYEMQAREINELQKKILEIVKSEKPFDVFICYKETDDSGVKTHDSVIANEIYHELTNSGLKVFFSAITLEDKLGEEYEPYIFAALTSAKVMLVLGTKPEYFNAVWVKNEWSRYLHLMKTDRQTKRTLIPCFRDMDAYDLPDEFSHLQALDMANIAFMPDLTRNIQKLIGRNPADNKENSKSVEKTIPPEVLQGYPTIWRPIFSAIYVGDYEKADQLLGEVEQYLAWLEQEGHDKNSSEFVSYSENIKIAKFMINRELPFDVDVMFDESMPMSIREAGPHLQSAYLALYNGDFEQAEILFDSALLVQPYNSSIYLAKVMIDKKVRFEEDLENLPELINPDEYFPEQYYDGWYYQKLVDKYNQLILSKGKYNSEVKQSVYDSAVAKLENGSYDEAESLFRKVGNYKNAPEMAEYCQEYQYQPIYDAAIVELEKGSYVEAEKIFKQIEHYKDAKEMALYCQNYEKQRIYDYAISLAKSKDYYGANREFWKIRGFKNTNTLIEKCDKEAKSDLRRSERIATIGGTILFSIVGIPIGLLVSHAVAAILTLFTDRPWWIEDSLEPLIITIGIILGIIGSFIYTVLKLEAEK